MTDDQIQKTIDYYQKVILRGLHRAGLYFDEGEIKGILGLTFAMAQRKFRPKTENGAMTAEFKTYLVACFRNVYCGIIRKARREKLMFESFEADYCDLSAPEQEPEVNIFIDELIEQFLGKDKVVCQELLCPSAPVQSSIWAHLGVNQQRRIHPNSFADIIDGISVTHGFSKRFVYYSIKNIQGKFLTMESAPFNNETTK